MNKSLVLVLLLVIVCFGAYNALDSDSSLIPESPVKHIVVESDGVLAAAEIIEMLGVEYGQEVTDSVLTLYSNKLNSIDYIDTAEVYRSAFGKLEIEIVEEKPVASAYNDGWGYILSNGVFVKKNFYNAGILPIIRLDDNVQLLVDILSRIKKGDEAFYSSISEIAWNKTLDAAVVYIKNELLKIYIGKDSDFESLASKYRVLRAKGLCENLKEHTVDLRFAEFAYLR